MRDLFIDDRGLEMSRSGDPILSGVGAVPAQAADFGGGVTPGEARGSGQGSGRSPLAGRHVCPFCGAVNESAEGACPRCTMENTADTRKATKSRIGPWYVLQSRNPAAPGMRYDTLLGFVRKGRVKARSIVRGPTTHQLWRFACQVKGLSREFGVCYSCGGVIDRATHTCPQCNRLQDPPLDPDTFIEGQSTGAVAAPAMADSAPLGAQVAISPTITLSHVAPPPAAPVAPPAEPERPPVFRELKVPQAPNQEVAGPAAAAAAPVTATPSRGDVQPLDPAAPAGEAPAAAPAAAPGGAPVPAGRRKAGDVLISAKELAAAFQLHFDSDAQPDDTSGAFRAAGYAPGGADAPLPWPPRRRRKRRVGRYVLAALLLALLGFGAFLVFDGAFRRQALAWAGAKYDSITGADLYPDLSAANRAAPKARATSQPAASNVAAVPRPGVSPETGAGAVSGAAVVTPSRRVPLPPPPEEEPDDVPARPVAPPAQPSSTGANVGRQGGTPAAGAAGPDATRASVTPVPPPIPAPAATQTARTPRVAATTGPAVAPARAATTAPVPALTLAQAQQKSRAWYFQALDAEAKDDFKTARELYKKITEELPREIDGQEVWFQDVEARLKYADKVLGVK
jgi:hypothetical protein